jgi:pimeloyl-ACP methyl ester carboxylesterase
MHIRIKNRQLPVCRAINDIIKQYKLGALEGKSMKEKTYQTPCGTIHYWTNVSHSDEITLVFLPGLTADHRLFDKQIQYFENRYNVIVWDAPAHASSWPFRFDFDLFDK